MESKESRKLAFATILMIFLIILFNTISMYQMLDCLLGAKRQLNCGTNCHYMEIIERLAL